LSEKVEKVRISVTMTKPYLDALDRLVEEGVYLGRGDAILDALRSFFRGYGVEPFVTKVAEPET
jgi:metal-responsive CopG/Arc/MetJ family transcriptional regulator